MPDKIMLWNQGYLPATWTLEKLLQKHSSEPYNPDISSAFFRAGHIESWGQGILKIIRECKKENKPEPVFSYDAPGFTVTFEAGVEKTSGKTSGKIVALIKKNEDITIPELASLIGVSERSIERNIHGLQKNKKLERIGSAKAGHWKIME